MKYREFIQKYEKECIECNKEINVVKILIKELEKISSTELFLKYEEIINENTKTSFLKLFNDYLINNKPIQYLLKSQSFYGIDFYIEEGVLIPRRETEELVDYFIKYQNSYFNNTKKINILDLCTGSGCIGLSIKNILKDKCEMTLADISEKSIEISTINKNKLNLNVNIIKSDLFKNLNNKYDCIISNPPYIPYYQEVPSLVKDNEPNLALYADNDGLYFYEEILKQAKNYLNNKAIIAFEHGENQHLKINEYANMYFNNPKIINLKDLQDRDRMTFIFINEE